ncbi:DEAD/DEAH box helicase, partial [Paenibacillus larvae]
LNSIFDYIDDGLLAMHEDFSTDDVDINWIDDVFRNSLALIQAESENEETYLDLLKARTTALLRRIPNRSDRKKLISSSVPLSVSQSMLDDIEFFRDLALIFIQSSVGENDDIQLIDNIIRELEIWSTQKAHNLMNTVPQQTALDNMRRPWISGNALASIMTIEQDAGEISKDYYGFTLPWIIHAISQLFDHEMEENVVQLYTSLAMFVELGLPNNEAVNIYMAGVRSRSAALELSAFNVFKNKSISDIKQALLDFSVGNHTLSDNSRVWIELFKESSRTQARKKVDFPDFTWKKHNFPDKLYLQVVNGDYFLTSSDGYFYEKVESTDDLPFSNIANISGLFFIYENDKWQLRSYNPRIVINDGD